MNWGMDGQRGEGREGEEMEIGREEEGAKCNVGWNVSQFQRDYNILSSTKDMDKVDNLKGRENTTWHAYEQMYNIHKFAIIHYLKLSEWHFMHIAILESFYYIYLLLILLL